MAANNGGIFEELKSLGYIFTVDENVTPKQLSIEIKHEGKLFHREVKTNTLISILDSIDKEPLYPTNINVSVLIREVLKHHLIKTENPSYDVLCKEFKLDTVA